MASFFAVHRPNFYPIRNNIMKKLYISIFIIFSLNMVNASVLQAMQVKTSDRNIQKMLSLAQHIKSTSSDLVELSDCQEIPVREIMQYIEENEQGNNLFSSTTIQTLALTPQSLLIEAYEIALKNMHKPKNSYSYDYHAYSLSDND